MGRKKLLLVCLTTILLLLAFTITSMAEDTLRAGKIHDFKGNVQVKKSGGEKSFSVFKGMALTQGDTIITDRDAWVSIEIDEKTKVKVDEKTQININRLMEDNEEQTEDTRFNLRGGKVWSNIGKSLNAGSKYEIKTPTAIMGVRGTRFFVGYSPQSDTTNYTGSGTTEVVVLEGAISASIQLPGSPDVGLTGESGQKIELTLEQNQQMTLTSTIINEIAQIIKEQEEITGQRLSTQELNEIAQAAGARETIEAEKLDLFVLETIFEESPEEAEQLLGNINSVIEQKREARALNNQRELAREQLEEERVNQSAPIYDEQVEKDPSRIDLAKILEEVEKVWQEMMGQDQQDDKGQTSDTDSGEDSGGNNNHNGNDGDNGDDEHEIPNDYHIVSLAQSTALLNGSDILGIERVISSNLHTLSFNLKNKYGDPLKDKEIEIHNGFFGQTVKTDNYGNAQINFDSDEGLFLITVDDLLLGKIYSVPDSYGVVLINARLEGEDQGIKTINIANEDNDYRYTIDYSSDGPLPKVQSIALPEGEYYVTEFVIEGDIIVISHDNTREFSLAAGELQILRIDIQPE